MRRLHKVCIIVETHPNLQLFAAVFVCKINYSLLIGLNSFFNEGFSTTHYYRYSKLIDKRETICEAQDFSLGVRVCAHFYRKAKFNCLVSFLLSVRS